jgi:hypothetical protein
MPWCFRFGGTVTMGERVRHVFLTICLPSRLRGTGVGSDTFVAELAGTIGQPLTRRSRGRPRKDDKK